MMARHDSSSVLPSTWSRLSGPAAGFRLLAAVIACAMAALMPASRATGQQAGDYVELEEQAVRRAAERAAPWVVRIETLGGLEAVGGKLVTQGPTTGVLISDDGYVVSSAFNFVQLPSAILVTLAGGDRRPAKLVAHDRSRMLVLLKIKPKPGEKLPVPTMVGRDELRVGQTAIALGRTYPGDLPSISAGIISALHRIWGRAVQTDAKVSPANYGGPLIDLQGRLIGVLVPMSPQQQSEMAGAEWYDSGIGFAVPLTDLQPHFERWKSGRDLLPGKLGISLKGTNVFADPAIVAAVAPKSPAREAGMQAKDRIVDIDGRPIRRQAELKHALGPRYAGETVHVVVERGKQKKRVSFDIELAAKIEPYTHPFLGVVPVRLQDDDAGIGIRFVYPGSPAAKAGLKAGDRLLAIAGTKLKTLDDALESLLPFEPGREATVEFARDGKNRTARLTFDRLPSELPTDVPPPAAPNAEAGEATPTGLIEVNVPEEPNQCYALVPKSYRPDVPHGLLVWLRHPGKEFDQKAWRKRWEPLCQSMRLIVMAPQPADERRWSPTEAEYIAKAVEEFQRSHRIDPHRIVVGGEQTGGVLAYLAAFPRRDLFHGVVAFNAPYPPRRPLPANEPAQRLAVLSIHTDGNRAEGAIETTVKGLAAASYPVTSQTTASNVLTPDLQETIARWIDLMVRF